MKILAEDFVARHHVDFDEEENVSVVKIEVATNKQTYERRIVQSETETLERVSTTIDRLTELS